MKKTLSRLADRLAAGLLAVALVCGVLACDNGSSDKDDGPTYSGPSEGTGGATTSAGSSSTSSSDTNSAGTPADTTSASTGSSSSGSTSSSTVPARSRTGSKIMKSGQDVNAILKSALGSRSLGKYSLRLSATPPVSSVTTYALSYDDSPVDVLVWLPDRWGNDVFYYAEGYTDSGKKIPLDEDSSKMFYECSCLKEVDLSGFDTSKVTDMSNMFKGCSYITSLDVSNFDTSEVTDMTEMFYECSALTVLDLSSFDTGKVTSFLRMFLDCSNLVTIYASDRFVAANASARAGSFSMFAGCEKIVGGNGTTYEYDTVALARIDGGTSAPGYFTARP